MNECSKAKKPIDGGDILDGYSWTQSIDDITLTVPLPVCHPPIRGVDVSCLIEAAHLCVTVITKREPSISKEIIIQRDLPHRVIPKSSEYSLTDNILIIDLEKKTKEFWDKVFDGDPAININSLVKAQGTGRPGGMNEDPNQPRKIEDPEDIARIVEQHPELAAGLAPRMMELEENAKKSDSLTNGDEQDIVGSSSSHGIGEQGMRRRTKRSAADRMVTQSIDSSTYIGKSAFEW